MRSQEHVKCELSRKELIHQHKITHLKQQNNYINQNYEPFSSQSIFRRVVSRESETVTEEDRLREELCNTWYLFMLGQFWVTFRVQTLNQIFTFYITVCSWWRGTSSIKERIKVIWLKPSITGFGRCWILAAWQRQGGHSSMKWICSYTEHILVTGVWKNHIYSICISWVHLYTHGQPYRSAQTQHS